MTQILTAVAGYDSHATMIADNNSANEARPKNRLSRKFIRGVGLALLLFTVAACGGKGGDSDSPSPSSGGDDYGSDYGSDYGGGNGGGNGTKPGTPTGLSATQSGSSVYVSWNNVSGATNYNVYRSSSSSGTYSQIGSQSGTGYSDNSPITGYNYYKVSASNSAGESAQSSSVSCNYTSGSGGGGGTGAKPNTPSGLSATLSGSSISVSWSSVSGATSYKVFWSNSSSGTYSQISNPTGTSYTDNSPVSGYNYYKVSAVNSAGESAQSSYVSCNYTVSGGTKPSAPTGVTASRTPRSNQYVTVSWNAVSGATSYKIYYSMSATGTYQSVGTATGTSGDKYFYNDLTSYWKVSAVNSAGESALSSTYGTALGWQ